MSETSPEIIQAPTVGLTLIRRLPEFERVVQAAGVDDLAAEVWWSRIEAGEMDMIAAFHDQVIAGRVNVLWSGPGEPAVIEEVGAVPVVNSLYVNPDKKRRGIGYHLMAACEHAAREHRGTPPTLCLGVEPGNLAARALYEKVGYRYRQVAGRPTYLTSWVEQRPEGPRARSAQCLLMVKNVGPKTA